MNKVTRNEYTYARFIEEYPDDDACLQKIFEMTYGQMTECPQCSSDKGYARVKGRKAYQCRRCYFQVHPLVGTAFEETKLPLTKWFYVMFLFTVSKNGVAAHEVSRSIGVTPKTGLRMLKKIREYIYNDESPLSGQVEADEALIGGRQHNRHMMVQKRYKEMGKVGGRSTIDKALVFGLIERGGRVIAHVIEDATIETLHASIYKHIEVGSNLLTDEYNGYHGLSTSYIHEACNHKTGKYVDGNASTNSMENYWSCLKRTIKGSYISVSRKYLPLYIKESVFRHNHREKSDMFNELLNCLAS